MRSAVRGLHALLSAQASPDSCKHARYGGWVRVSLKQIVLSHALCVHPPGGRQQGAMRGEGGIGSPAELAEAAIGKQVPVTIEQVIEPDIDDHSGKASFVAAEQFAQSAHFRVRIREGIDPSVQQNAPFNVDRQLATKRALDVISEQCADDQRFVIAGKVKMREVIHRGKRPLRCHRGRADDIALAPPGAPSVARAGIISFTSSSLRDVAALAEISA